MKCVSIYLTFIFLEWICIILALASWSGLGNSIFLSSRPTVTNKGNFPYRKVGKMMEKHVDVLVKAWDFRSGGSNLSSTKLHVLGYFIPLL